MRVLHVYRIYYPDPPGGLQEAIRQIALSTKPLGVKNRIYCLSTSPTPIEVKREEGSVFRSRSWAAPASCDIGFVDSIRQFAFQTQWADIIHYHFPWPFADFLHFITKPEKPTIMTYHSDVVGKGVLGHIYMPLMKRMLRCMNAVVSTSPAYIESSPILKSSVSPDRLRFSPLGIGEETYSSYFKGSKLIDLVKRFGLDPGHYFLFLGVLRPYKGLEYLISASEFTDFPVAIAGAGSMKYRLTKAGDCHRNVHFLGQVSDAEKIALIKGCCGLVLPSHLRSEAFGMVLVEAAMCCKPLISCEIGTGTSFVNSHQETGFVVSPESPDELATAMNRLAVDHQLAERMGCEARSRYERLFSGKALGKAYIDLYHEIVG